MLNIGPLGGEGVPFFCIVSCSIAKNNSHEWYFFSIKEEERFCSIHTSHKFKGNSTESVSFCVLAFEENREKWPHLLVGFYPVLGFPSHILCLFVDGV